MDKIWLNSYPKTVSPQIDTTTYHSVVHILESAITKHNSKPAYENMGKILSYAELDKLTQQFANYLSQDLKLSRGDRVAVMMPNLLQYPVAIFGILRAGMVVVNCNPMYTTRELEHQLNDSGAKAIVVIENTATTLEQIIQNTKIQKVITTQIGDLLGFPKANLVNYVVKHKKKLVPEWNIKNTISFNEVLKKGSKFKFNKLDLSHKDIAFLQYTGGTTGLSKGAILSHGNIVSNVLQARAWMAHLIKEGQELIITALPLYHIFALTANCLVFMSVGGKNVLVTDPRNMKDFVKELSKHKFTTLTGVNTLFNGLLNTPEFAQLDFSALRLTLGGGAAVQQSVAAKWKQITGKPLSEAYGLTETSPAASMNPLDLDEHNGCIGLPLPNTEFSLRSVDNCEQEITLKDGETWSVSGELCIKGPQVMQGYWQREEDTKKTFTADGYLRTGDIAEVNAQGFFKIVDRLKDMILVSGFNVYPNEIEEVVASHPGVLEVACVGVKDEKTGEAVKVVVVKKDENLTADQLKQFCKEKLVAYKAPKIIEFRDSLPKSNVGKILRRELR